MKADNYHFSYLLTTLVFMLLLHPFVFERPFATEAINISFSITLLTAIYAVAGQRKELIIAGILGTATLLLHWLSYFDPQLLSPSIAVFSAILFFACCVCLLLINFIHRTRISADTLCGAVAIYLMIGLLWSFVYLLIAHQNPAAFSISFANAKQFTDFIYFSFVTLTTLGYGDISPISPPARTLAYIEAILGQIYLAIIVAKFIGLHLSGGPTAKKR